MAKAVFSCVPTKIKIPIFGLKSGAHALLRGTSHTRYALGAIKIISEDNGPAPNKKGASPMSQVQSVPLHQTVAIPRRQAQKTKRRWNHILFFSAVVAAAAAIAAVGLLAGSGGGAPAPDPIPTILFQGKEIAINEKLSVNPYDKTAFYVDERGWLHYSLNGVSAKQGIDVSSHQREIDWQQVADSGVDFAIIRVGYRGYTAGSLFYDTYYKQNIEGALAAGLDVGVYFFSQAVNTTELYEEMNMLLSAIEGYHITYPVVFDWEYVSDSSSRTYNTTGREVTALAVEFCQYMELAGYQPCVYFNQTMGYLKMDMTQIQGWTQWLAEYRTQPQYYYYFDLWQYTSSGTVPGIEGRTDMNLSFFNMT